MEFGSDTTFQKMKTAVSTGDELLYNEFLEIVIQDSKKRLRGFYKVSEKDAEDITQEICVTVWKHAVRFVLNSEALSVGERNNWLKRVIDSKFNVFFRKHKEMTKEEAWWKQQEDKSDSTDEYHDKLEEWVYSTIEGLLKINTEVQNIIAFLENKIVIGFEYGLGNGKPKEVQEELDGLPLNIAAAMTVDSIEKHLHIILPSSFKTILFERVKEKGEDAIFHMTAKNISDKTSWISKKLENKNDLESDE